MTAAFCSYFFLLACQKDFQVCATAYRKEFTYQKLNVIKIQECWSTLVQRTSPLL